MTSRRHARRTGARSSSSRSTRSPRAGAASRARTATSSSSAAPLPGDRVRARLTKAQRDYAEGDGGRAPAARAPSGSPTRCVHEGEPCPGAPWQGMAYERQLAEKRAPGRRGAAAHRPPRRLRARADRAGGRAEWRYRNKLEYSFGERPGELALGFHRRGSWAEIVDVDDCLLASEANNAARNAVREWGHGQGIPAYDSRAQTGVLRNLVVREGRRTGPAPDPPGHLAGARSRARRSTCTR